MCGEKEKEDVARSVMQVFILLGLERRMLEELWCVLGDMIRCRLTLATRVVQYSIKLVFFRGRCESCTGVVYEFHIYNSLF